MKAPQISPHSILDRDPPEASTDAQPDEVPCAGPRAVAFAPSAMLTRGRYRHWTSVLVKWYSLDTDYPTHPHLDEGGPDDGSARDDGSRNEDHAAPAP